MKELTIKEALEQGYSKYLFTKDGFQGLRDIEGMDEKDLEREDIRLVEREPYHPAGMSSEDIAELLAENIEENHCGECGDDTMQVYETIKDLDFKEAEQKISEALSSLSYYRGTDIKLIANRSNSLPSTVGDSESKNQ